MGDRNTRNAAQPGVRIVALPFVAGNHISQNAVSGQLQTVREMIGSVNAGAFMGTNPENEAQPKVNECIALNGPSGHPFIESAHDLQELASQQDERAPQYEGDAIE